MKRKNKYLNTARIEMQNRLQGMRRLSIEEKEQIRQKKLSFKDKYEYRLRGAYERIYPLTEE